MQVHVSMAIEAFRRIAKIDAPSFVHSPHSRERLDTTKYMFTLCLTYQQVIPQFLDFILPLGIQDNERGFNLSGFRYQTRLHTRDRGIEVPELGWSGCDFQLCFNLKSVERASGGGEPWSIRQAAIHHLFDVQSGRASWIVVKANRLLESRMKSATGSRGHARVNSYQEIPKAFVSTLNTHLMFCGWAGENWSWYIGFLEDNFQETTRNTLSPLGRTPTSPRIVDGSSRPLHIPKQDASTFPRAREGRLPPQPSGPPVSDVPGFQFLTEPKDPPAFPYDNARKSDAERRRRFSFADLQRTHNIEEKANAAMLVIKNNMSVLGDLRKYYRTIMTFQEWPTQLTTQCEVDMLLFEQDMMGIENDLQLQLSRIQTLLHLIADRKNLVG